MHISLWCVSNIGKYAVIVAKLRRVRILHKCRQRVYSMNIIIIGLAFFRSLGIVYKIIRPKIYGIF